MEYFRNSNPLNAQRNMFPSNHGFSNVQNSHTNASSNIHPTVFRQQFNSSKFSVNNESLDIRQFQNTSSSCTNSTVRTPFKTYCSEIVKPMNNSSLRSSYLPPKPSNNLQLNQRFPFRCNQPQYMKTDIPPPVQNSNMLSHTLPSAYHPHDRNFHNMNDHSSNQVRPINPSTISNDIQQLENKLPSHIPLPNQNISWPITLPPNLPPPPPVLPRLPESVSSTFISENNCTNFNDALKQFSTPNISPYQREQLSSNFPPISADNFPLPPFFPPMVPSSYAQASNPMSAFSAGSEKERQLLNFVNKFHPKEKDHVINKKNLTVVEFRSALKIGLTLLKILSETKNTLMKLLESDEDQWNSCAKNALQLQNQLTEVCNMLCNPQNLTHVQSRLLNIKKKREYKKRRKLAILSMKQDKEKCRKELNQEIDKWLDNIKEKNLDIKRKTEMKKEADNILSEVRRKIHEAKRTIEKLKTFEKLRNARQANAMKKSLFIQPEHSKNFEEKLSVLKKVMLKQLADYEAEERALKVMLETEQEEQLEQEALWRIRKMKTILQRKKKNISECLFGDTDEPSPEDPIYLFYAHHTSANNSISSLVQIRHQWDVYLANDGESIPQQWIVPVTPSNAMWEKFCSS
ncbi:programmed cell death protein 7-like [Uloborus diversus]|uniref:programmed cell death protein 7-like n=1 Tax=Uloborus diversus TaxID=327109 RepID=UPI00240A2E59|nr:programmed cell death protein 7-like [Uloborus diversus]